MMQVIVLLVGTLAGISLLVGVVLGLVVAIWAQDTESALRIIDNGYTILVGLLPIMLLMTLYVTRNDEEYEEAYKSPLRALLTTIQGAIVGSILGAGPIFLTAAINLPVILSDFDIVEFGPAVRNTIIWSRLLLAVGATVLSAIPIGLWVHYTGTGWKDQ